MNYRYRGSFQNGFTLIELLIVLVIVAILLGLLAPVWLRFVNRQRLETAQSVVYQGIQKAQIKAKQNHSYWQFSIRHENGTVEWSTHPTVATPVNWESVGHRSIQLDDETTLQPTSFGRTVRFDHNGNVDSRLGRVTLSNSQFGDVKRCVYVSTIIGALRQSKEQSRPRRGDFCY